MLPGTYREDDPKGVRHDTLIDARVEVNGYKQQLEETYVTFDSIADDNEGVWTDDERTEIRQMQKTVRTLIEECDDMLADIETELSSLD